MNVLANDQVTADARIASFTQPEFGKVSVSPSNTKLVYEPEPYQFGLVHFSYTVGSGQQKSSADVELAIGKSWTMSRRLAMSMEMERSPHWTC